MTVDAARALLADLSERGVKVEAAGNGKLRYAPRDEIDKLTLIQLRLHKQTLLRILSYVPAEEEIPSFVRKELERASELGLVAKWSSVLGYVSIHDPTSGEWHDVQMKDAPSWAKWEAMKRKELTRGGDRRAYDLTASEMSEIWESEHAEEGIFEDHPVEED